MWYADNILSAADFLQMATPVQYKRNLSKSNITGQVNEHILLHNGSYVSSGWIITTHERGSYDIKLQKLQRRTLFAMRICCK